VVIEILNAEVVGREVRDNPHVEGQKTKKRHGEAEAIIHLLGDCSLFMGRPLARIQWIRYRLVVLTVSALLSKELMMLSVLILMGDLKGSTITTPTQKSTFHVPKGLIPNRVIGREKMIEEMEHSENSHMKSY